MPTLAQAQRNLAAELRQAGWKIAKDAMSPLEKIDFAKLVQIHDHEEHFLSPSLSFGTTTPNEIIGLAGFRRAYGTTFIY